MGDIALFGVLHSEKGDKTNMKQRSPDRSTLPSPLKQAMARGSPSLPSVGQEAPHQPQGLAGRARQRREGSSCHSAAAAPRGTFTTSPILHRLLDGASKAIPGLYFIVTFICKGCQSGPGSRLPCCSSLFVTHTPTEAHPRGNPRPNAPRDTQRTPKNTPPCSCHGHTNLGSMNRGHQVAQPQGAPRVLLLLSYVVTRYTQQGTVSLCAQAHAHTTEAHPQSHTGTPRARGLRPRTANSQPSGALRPGDT